MSSDRPRRAGTPAFASRKPELRLVKNSDERPRPEPDSELKVILDNMRRRHGTKREREWCDPGGKDAA